MNQECFEQWADASIDCRLFGRTMNRIISIIFILASIGSTCPLLADDSSEPRAVIPKVTNPITVDGQLTDDEYQDAFCAPIEYFNTDISNRPGQFFYLWDEDALYVALRTLDQKPFAAEAKFWEGDAVEFYLDTRRGDNFLGAEWPREPSPGAVHCFFTAMDRDQLRPRFMLRPGFEQAIPQTGIGLAARRTTNGLELEMRLPWSNFPEFKATAGQVIGLDSELSYSDGKGRTDRSFVFGNPLSVHHPANLGRVKLVDRITRTDWQACGPVMMPMRIDMPWNQTTLPLQISGQIAIPPGKLREIGQIVFCVFALNGQLLGEFPAENEANLDPDHLFTRRTASWPATLAAPGQFQVHAVIRDPNGNELSRVAPRLMSVNSVSGY
jgi:hypothetical protein